MIRFVPMLATLALLAACGESVRDDHFANDIEEARPADAPVVTEAVPVRIGELGPSFAACNAAGTTRGIAEGQGLAARAAPFDSAEEVGRVAAGSRFFVCTRTLDQRWLGIVWNKDGILAPRCGVAAPLPRRTTYQGPCESGWVAAASVRLVAG